MTPSSNRDMPPRRFTVARSEQGRSLADVVRARLRLPREEAVHLIQQRRVRLLGSPCLDPGRRVHPGQRIEVLPPPHGGETPDRSHKGPRPVLRHVDLHIVVVEKPAGLTTMRHAHETAEFGSRARRFLPPTLADLLPGLIAEQQAGKPGRVRAVHRLDKETSGLLVFARTVEAERHLGQQFRAHATERLYRAIVRGPARSQRIESWLLEDRGDGRRGSSPTPGQGQRAVTHVRVVEELGDYTLVECRLETGRTHQVRIHLGEAGTPLCGETVYDRPLHGAPIPDGSGAPRVALHAATLGFVHPATGQGVRWETPLPADLAGVLKRLRGRSEPRPSGSG
jgi:23S rRNA pseudouridine1911/1915/1917 synthase